MSRVALSKTKAIIIASAVVVIAGAGTVCGVIANSPSHKVSTVVNSQHQTTEISYKGQAGQNALTLLKKHATVQTKHYSFGDLVTSINGSASSATKYWTFYVNGKESSVGASSYTTKSSDTIEWKLQ